MLKDLKNNLIFKKYLKKPNFISDSFILKSKNLLLKDKLDDFLVNVAKLMKSKKLNSNEIFHFYSYLLNSFEKDNKTNDFLKKYVYSRLSSKMYFIYTNLIDIEIYQFLLKSDTNFKKIKDKDVLFVKVSKDYINLLDLINKLDVNKIKTIKSKVITVKNYLRHLIKSKQLNKKIANYILDIIYWELSYDFELDYKDSSIKMNDFLKPSDFKI
jgi:hypothetical protein